MAKKEGSHLAHLLRVELSDQPTATFNHVIAIDGVEYLFALLAAGHQAELLEDAQVMGDGRLGHRKSVHDVADAHFSTQEHLQDPLTGFISQGFAELYTINGHSSSPNP